MTELRATFPLVEEKQPESLQMKTLPKYQLVDGTCWVPRSIPGMERAVCL